MSQRFGGNWTEQKMEMVVAYAKAYLTIMNKNPILKIIYFDGFAGSGIISNNGEQNNTKGTALRILDIEEPRQFDIYYFVELDINYKRLLEERIESEYSGRKIYVVNDDCNKKLKDLSEFLKNHVFYRALIFIDPYGMSVNWESIESLKGLNVDLWILVPSGIGANRLLKKDGKISDSWYKKLESFLGMERIEIDRQFYKTTRDLTLFGEENNVEKYDDAISKLGGLYADRLKSIFQYVSKPFLMRNSSNSIMYHFMMATNNSAGLQIANDVIKSKFNSNGTKFD